MNVRKRILLVAATAMMTAGMFAGEGVMKSPSLANTRIQGIMMYDNEKSVENTGVYSYTVTAPVTRKPVTIIDRISVGADAVVNNGKIYTFIGQIDYGYVTSANYYVYDIATGQQVSKKSMGYDLATVYSHMATSSATDPTTGIVYVSGYDYNTDTRLLYSKLKTWDLEGNTKTTVGDLPGSFIAMAFDATGQLYAITGSPSQVVDGCGQLVKVDKATGQCTMIGATGVTPKFDQSAVIDPATGIFYWFANDDKENANLYTVSLTTGKATLIGAMPNGDEVVGAWIPAQTTPDAAPSPASDITAAFEGRSLKGSVSFNTPTLDFSGKALTGNLTWKVTDGTTLLAEGQTTPGTSVNASVEVSTPGMITFTVTLTNEAGTSPADEITRYVGPDVPAAVTGVTLSREGDVNTLTWTAPAKGLNNAYMVADELTYRIVRMPEGKVVAEAVKGTSFSETFAPEQLQSISYTVTPVNYGVEGASAASNAIKAGAALLPPFADNLATAASLDLYTIIDANNDNRTWAYYSASKAIRYTASFSAAADDWLILPPMKLEAGCSYEFSFDGYGGNARYTNLLDVHLGTAADAASMGTPLQEFSYSNVAASSRTDKVILYPQTSGVYYIGLHLKSASSQSYFYIKNISLSAGRSTAVPARITDLTVTPADKGALAATIAFTAPTLTAGGDKLDNLSGIEIRRNDVLVTTLADGQLGTGTLTVIDSQVPAAGHYTYTATPVNSIGAGEAASAEAYIGPDTPLEPTDVVLTDNFNGTATVTWKAPDTVGANGGYVNSEALVYTIQNSKSAEIKADVTGTSAEIPFDITSDTQAEFYVKVCARNQGSTDKSAFAQSTSLLSGKPYAVPFNESFANAAYQTTPWTKVVIEGKSYNSSWNLRADADQDNDGAGADLNAQAAGSVSRLEGPKVDISKSVKPQLSMWVKIPYDGMTFTLQLKKGNDDWVSVKTLADETDWTHVVIDLTPYITPSLRIGLHGNAAKASFLYVDNIALTDVSTTGVDAIATASATVTALPGAIAVEAPEATDITVYTTSGVCVARVNAASAVVPVSSGLYIVRVGNTTAKVAVR